MTKKNDFEVELTMRSPKHDCHTAYRLDQEEIANNSIPDILRSMAYRLQDFIDTKASTH